MNNESAKSSLSLARRIPDTVRDPPPIFPERPGEESVTEPPVLHAVAIPQPAGLPYEPWRKRKNRKIMISIGEPGMKILRRESKNRGITIQEFLRAVIIGDWVIRRNRT